MDGLAALTGLVIAFQAVTLILVAWLLADLVIWPAMRRFTEELRDHWRAGSNRGDL